MTKNSKMSKVALYSMIMLSVFGVESALAASIVDEANTKAVNQVRWHKQEDIRPETILQRDIPQTSASVFFLRPLDQDSIQTSANVSINDRFQVSLQPGHYSQVYSCSGVNQLSAEITGHKNNDLLRNALSFKLEPQTAYFFYVDVNGEGKATVTPLTKENALQAMKGMAYQTHQISRVVPDCSNVAEPAPLAPPVTSEYESIDLKILFDSDKSFVKSQYYSEIKRVADFMTRHPEVVATIEGHTDSQADDKYNMQLSQRRVDEVKKILITKYGISAERLNSLGYGEARPIASNATAAGRQKNRRVVAVFTNGKLK